MKRIAVVGGGVIGYSTAIRLAERGHRVTLISGQEPLETTSATAAAYWAPYWIGQYDHRWASDTLKVLQQLAHEPGTGVKLTPAEEWLDAAGAKELDEELDEAYWWRHLPGIDWSRGPVREPRSMTLPGTSTPIEFVERVQFETPVARMPDYLAYLRRRFLELPGSEVRAGWVESLAGLLDSEGFDLVINCTGWQAKHAVAEEREGPESMRLLAGYVLRMPQIPGQPLITMHRGPFHDTPLYMVPRSGSEEDMICGGTAILTEPAPPARDLLRGDEAIFEQILARCVAFEPRLAGQQPLQKLVGLRPVRKAVRLEPDPREPRIIHHYGHGGSGLTLSWGSADAVVRIVDETAPGGL
ncbi:FAD-dependent oxidoreductase [Candidatus Laterigemmans baculatus]|uniref:FAD-dependent oxidoreductase n=1 Tax=Candidatus Laterigemmans baculatus TaxID=2770505 RepID=UPI0013DB8454|nr:FAD-dependent oxidoreductase [Candidatus Laterigemmans baculatus]